MLTHKTAKVGKMFGLFSKRRYLFYLIDDETDVLEVITDILETHFSCNVETFTSTKDALASLQQASIAPDLIYSDIRMGKVSGLCIREQLKELEIDIPILFVTGLTGQERFQDGYWSINKPIAIASLKKYTKEVLCEHREKK